jgi:predicted mannosyl-3-phosphoglycerate phosphatase (HAD superfamily)
MSGGSFNYAYTKVEKFVEKLDEKLNKVDYKDQYGSKTYEFEPETLEQIKIIRNLAECTAKLMKEIEWLYSGDTSDDTFMKSVEEISFKYTMKKLNEKNTKD